MKIATQAHQRILNDMDREIEELERKLRHKQEARREYINRNNLNPKPGVGSPRGDHGKTN